jgi:hypothetical protein
MRKLALATLATVATFGVATVGSESASAALAPCRDSNGSAPGGSVYLGYSSTYRCDVSPPQRLHLTGTPSNAACQDSGGHGWTATYRICWDVDY